RVFLRRKPPGERGVDRGNGSTFSGAHQGANRQQMPLRSRKRRQRGEHRPPAYAEGKGSLRPPSIREYPRRDHEGYVADIEAGKHPSHLSCIPTVLAHHRGSSDRNVNAITGG